MNISIFSVSPSFFSTFLLLKFQFSYLSKYLSLSFKVSGYINYFIKLEYYDLTSVMKDEPATVKNTSHFTPSFSSLITSFLYHQSLWNLYFFICNYNLHIYFTFSPTFQWIQYLLLVFLPDFPLITSRTQHDHC